MLEKVLTVASVISFFALLFIMQGTTPSSSHPILILLVFVFIYMLALGLLVFFISVGSRLLYFVSNHRLKIISARRAYYYSTILALVPVMVLGMKSIGRTGLYDVALVVAFALVAIFYVYKRL